MNNLDEQKAIVKGDMLQDNDDPILPPNPQDMDWGEYLKKDVLKKLGKPPKLIKITAANVFDNRWRVDVWITKEVETGYSTVDSPSLPDGHSFFCIIKQGGKIIYKPEIKKLY
jgi:hypothetical protein